MKGRNWLLAIKLYKYESLCIALTWSNAPSVSYCGTFLSGSEASSTIQDSFTTLQLACVQRSKRRIASTWFCNALVSFIGRVIGRICQCWYCPRKCIISPIPITNPIIGASLAQSHWDGVVGGPDATMKVWDMNYVINTTLIEVVNWQVLRATEHPTIR